MQPIGRILRWIFGYIIAAPIGLVVWGLVLLVGTACNSVSPGWWATANRGSKDFFFETAFGILAGLMILALFVVLAVAMLNYAQLSGELVIAAGEPRSFIARSFKPLQLPYLIALSAGVVGMHAIHGTFRVPSSAPFVLWTLLALGYFAFLFGSWSALTTLL
jgi:hypothetical protein